MGPAPYCEAPWVHGVKTRALLRKLPQQVCTVRTQRAVPERHVTEGLRLGVLRCFDGACLVWMTICGTVIIVIYFRCRYQGQVRRWPASIQQTGQGVAPCDMGHWLHLCTSMCGCTIH